MFKKILIVLLTIIVIFTAYVFIEKGNVKITKYRVVSSKISPDFNGFKIAMISDFHNSENFPKVIKRISQISPDIIAVTGDAIDMEVSYQGNFMWLLEQIRSVAPIYFISGNHEVWSENHDALMEQIGSYGVNIINNKVCEIFRGDSAINLIGYKDIIYSDDVMRLEVMKKELDELCEKIGDTERFNVLLFHRANYFDTVSEYPFDLVLSGHTHGGEINLPYIQKYILKQNVYSTDYVKGVYEKSGSKMIVSGGVEDSFRLFNTPEVVEITLYSAR
ncbi:MAG: hypothetical protein GX541_03085 [Clostridiales bacterium]|nr:hypothetical protein [Clostridiales bacterium]